MIWFGISIALASPTSEYQDSVDKLRAGEYQSAEVQLNSLLEEGVYDPMVCLALGNAHYRQQEWGAAYGSFRRGLMLEPRNADLRHNLAVVEEKLGLQPSSPALLSVKELMAVFSLCATLLLLGLIVGGQRRRMICVLSGTALLFTGVPTLTGLVEYDQAVAIRKIMVRSTIGKGVDLYSIPVGEQVTLGEKDGDYWNVEHSIHGKGWVLASAIVPLDPDRNKEE